MEKLKNKISTNKYRIISFLLGSLCMYILMYILGFTALGDKCIINGDMMDNYIPAIRNLCRDIIDGESIFYSWSYGGGMNTSLYNAYYSFSPLNILYLIFYNCRVDLVTVACIVIKTGLAAMCFQLFVSSVNKVDGLPSVIFSLLYAMSSFQVAYNVSNIIWLDAMYMLPLICFFVYKLVNEKKWIGLSICYAYIFISNFYMGYMIAIAATLFLLLYVFAYEGVDKKALLSHIMRYGLAAVVAIALSAWVWLPTVYFMFEGNNVSTDIALVGSLNKNVLDIINQMFWGESGGYDALFPYIYCGMLVFVLIPMFFSEKNIDRKLKIGYGLVLAFLLVSCIISPIYAAWHGFDDPNSYPYRFSYVLSFFLCAIASLAYKHIEKTNSRKLICICVIYIAIYIAEIFWQKERFDATLLSNSWKYLGINAVLLLVWGSILAAHNRINEDYTKLLLTVMVLITSVEMVSNGYVTLTKEKLDISSRVKSESWILWDDLENLRAERISEDQDLFRVNAYQGMGVSTGTTYGYNNISYFSSAENVALRKALSKLGLLSSQRICLNFGLTEPVKMILGVKYDTYISRKVDNDINENGYEEASVVANEYTLGMGYMVAGSAQDYVIEGENAFDNVNMLISTMYGEPVVLFSNVEPNDIYCSGEGIDLYNDGSQYGLHYDEAVPADEAQLIFNYDSDHTIPIYAYIQNKEPSFFRTFYIDGGYESGTQKWGAVTTSYIKEMEENDTGYYMTIKQAGNTNNVAFDNILFYSYDAKPLANVYDRLSEEQIKTTEWKDGLYRGKIEVKSDNKLLFTSIPYESGWKAYVNEEEMPITPLVNDAFIGLELPGKGIYDVKFVFEAPGKKAGLIISLAGVLITVLAMLTECKRKNLANAKKEY